MYAVIKRIFVTAFALFVFNVFAIAQPSWMKDLREHAQLETLKRIELLVSMRKDVKEIAGGLSTISDSLDFLTTGSGEFRIQYTESECKTAKGTVPRGVVEEIYFMPKVEIDLAELKVPLRNFDRLVERDTPTIIFYRSLTAGIKLEVQNKHVHGMTFFPHAGLKFRCSA